MIATTLFALSFLTPASTEAPDKRRESEWAVYAGYSETLPMRRGPWKIAVISCDDNCYEMYFMRPPERDRFWFEARFEEMEKCLSNITFVETPPPKPSAGERTLYACIRAVESERERPAAP